MPRGRRRRSDRVVIIDRAYTEKYTADTIARKSRRGSDSWKIVSPKRSVSKCGRIVNRYASTIQGFSYSRGRFMYTKCSGSRLSVTDCILSQRKKNHRLPYIFLKTRYNEPKFIQCHFFVYFNANVELFLLHFTQFGDLGFYGVLFNELLSKLQKICLMNNCRKS